MSDIFISYARSTESVARQIADLLRGQGYRVWRDDELPAHRDYSEVIEERLRSAKAVVVIWSAEAVKSQWVRAEADIAREAGTMVQLTLDGAALPMPFNRIQCADMTGWTGETDAPGWRKVAASVGDLVNGPGPTPRPQEGPTAEAPPPLPAKPSIAVLPFANLSGDAEQDYFADGMVVEIVTALSRIRSIFVIASGSSLSLKGKTTSPREAARQLGVRYVLDGSVRKAGGRVRISVQLIDSLDGAQVWSHRFEDSLDDVFALQDKVALGVAGVIEPTVQNLEIQRAAGRPTENLGSYDLYLRALPLMRSYVRADMLAALDLLERAIVLDQNFALALAMAGACHSLAVIYGWADDPGLHRRLAMERVNRALKLASDDPEVLAFATRPMINLERDVNTSIALIDRAIELNPGSSNAWLFSALVRVVCGAHELAVEHVETSMRLDPMSPNRPAQLGILGMARFQQGRFGEALEQLKAWAKASDIPISWLTLAACYGHLGQLDAANEALARYARLSATVPEEMGAMVYREPAPRQLFLDGIALARG